MEQPSRSNWIERITAVFDELLANGKSSQEIFITLYADLRRLAAMKTARQPAGASMHATRLVSDLYVRLFGKASHEFEWKSAQHFFNAMAQAMNHLLVDYVRQCKSHGRDRVEPLDPEGADKKLSGANRNFSQDRVEQAIFTSELLDRLEREHSGEQSRIAERQAKIVRLRVILGFSEDEVADLLDCSSETVKKEFRKAKAKLAAYAGQESGWAAAAEATKSSLLESKTGSEAG